MEKLRLEKSESVHTPAKPCEPPRRRRCLDIEYKRQHGCVDVIDVILIAMSTLCSGTGLGIVIGMAA